MKRHQAPLRRKFLFKATIAYSKQLSSPRSSAGVSIIESGWWHTCALLTGGTVNCWGFNSHGQLGTGDTTDRHTPTAVVGLSSGEKGAIYFHYKITIFMPYIRFQKSNHVINRSEINIELKCSEYNGQIVSLFHRQYIY